MLTASRDGQRRATKTKTLGLGVSLVLLASQVGLLSAGLRTVEAVAVAAKRLAADCAVPKPLGSRLWFVVLL